MRYYTRFYSQDGLRSRLYPMSDRMTPLVIHRALVPNLGLMPEGALIPYDHVSGRRSYRYYRANTRKRRTVYEYREENA